MVSTKMFQKGGYRTPSIKIVPLAGNDEIVRTSGAHEETAEDIFGIRDGINAGVKSRNVEL